MTADEHDEDQASLSTLSARRRESAPAASPNLEKRSDSHNGFLAAPRPSAPIRPMSPDTLSIFSLDEFEQLSRTFSGNPSGTASVPPPPSKPRPGLRGKLDRFWIRNKGLGYMLFGQVFGVLMNVTVRYLEIEGNKGKGLHPFQILFARMSITFFLATAYMWYAKTPYFPFGMPEVRWLLIARGLAGFWGIWGMYYSILYLPIADATAITYLSPSLACYACAILLKEPFTRKEQLAGLISLCGVVLIARPTTLFAGLSDSPAGLSGDNVSTNSTAPAVSDASSYADITTIQRLTAVGVALLGVIGSAAVYTVLRWVGQRAHPLITVNYFAAWCFFVSSVAMSVLPEVGWLLPADLKEWGYLLFLGVCGFIMQFLMAAGLAYEKSSRATNMAYSSMIFALFADKIFFDHSPGVMSILGCSLIFGSAIVVATQQGPVKAEGKDEVMDDESRVGLMNGGEDHQLRTLR
ncbi:hypothetical protein BDY17DRAFT_302723 [Neohortaea acidophila]|uniref:EamA domain-containing protein n=1 Tax=Neohortaea acidophila TaxID=245834 RepID=A0A6A6PIE8_9PEZI|nr:uncharacterized protein BDY17DRAFT_302723 [Neohortaea acidophila]KAF2479818.1 hypothetical protein BDY17DRAFT_302723 [Neohortaea acidophila]